MKKESGRPKKREVFTEFQTQVIKAFDKRNADIDIVTLYTRIYGDAGELTARECQMKLGAIFAKINEASMVIHIEPGEIKRTYRLSTPPRVR